MKHVRFNLDYKMMAGGTLPLFIVGRTPDDCGYTSVKDWNFSNELIFKLTRLNELLDKTINWSDPKDESWKVSDEDRAEYMYLFPIVIEQIRAELGPEWQLEIKNTGKI